MNSLYLLMVYHDTEKFELPTKSQALILGIFRMQCLHFKTDTVMKVIMLVAVENLLKLMNWRRSWFEQIKLYSLTNTYFSLCPKLDFKYLSVTLFKADNTLFSFWSGHIIWQFSSLADKEISTYHTTWQGYEKTFSSNTFWCMCCTCCNCCTCDYCTCSTCS